MNDHFLKAFGVTLEVPYQAFWEQGQCLVTTNIGALQTSAYMR